jgi:7,8-dihydropterin-6-yl-methyl-4-(beta-D-ribofuranosyl)aminobenzene 5'-phosphate synthase
LDINAADIQAIILSHGHADHTSGLPGLIARLGMRNIPLVLHPDVYLERKVIFPDGTETNIPPLRKKTCSKKVAMIEE